MLDTNKTTVELSVCTNDLNYHFFNGVHVHGDGVMEHMRLMGYPITGLLSGIL